MQFAELANTIQSSFLGLKPSLTSTAQLVETIGRQLGYSYEAQKKGAQSLMSIQNKFPSVYEDIIAASNKLKEAEKRGEVRTCGYGISGGTTSPNGWGRSAVKRCGFANAF